MPMHWVWGIKEQNQGEFNTCGPYNQNCHLLSWDIFLEYHVWEQGKKGRQRIKNFHFEPVKFEVPIGHPSEDVKVAEV